MYIESKNGFNFHYEHGQAGASQVLPIVIERYVEMGYATPEDLINDENIHHSAYFWATNGNDELKGATRLILGQNIGVDNLPAIKHFEIDPTAKAKIQTLNKNEVAEIGRLATEKGLFELSLGLYRQVWQYSIQNQITHWVISADIRLMRILQMPKTRILFTQMGADRVFMGSVTRPAMSSLKELDRNFNPSFRQFLNEGAPNYQGLIPALI